MRNNLFILLICFCACTKTAPEIKVVEIVQTPTSTSVVTTKTFDGYKVQPFTNEVKYWRDCGVMWDVVYNRTVGSFFLPQIIAGDFNNDGWIDIFNPGTGLFQNKPVDSVDWLIWNPTFKMFESKNLFTDKNIKTFGGNQRRSVSVDLNKDGYTDIIIFDSGDDVPLAGTIPELQPIRIVLSNGKGEYELISINGTEKFYNHSGDVGDVDGDGVFDIVTATGEIVYILKGKKEKPYFDINTITKFSSYDNTTFREGAGQAYNVDIEDVDGNGSQDILLGCNEMKYPSKYNSSGFDFTTKILLNQGGGVFNKNGLINLPYYSDKGENFLANDFRVDDINNDGLKDIITTGSVDYDNWSIFTYIQTSKNVFVIDTTKIKYTINTNRKSGSIGMSWKPWLIYYDYDGDGQKDISYIDAHDFWNNSLKRKTIFIRKGNNFIEEDFYKYEKQ